MRFYVFLGFLALFLVGCDKVDSLTQFDMNYDESIVIPASTGINLPFDLFTPDMETDSESEFAVNNTRKNLIEEIVLKSLGLRITAPEDGDFSFLKSIEIYISAEDLEEVKIAWNDNIPENAGNELELETSDIDLKEYIKKDSFKLRLHTVTDKVLTSDYHIDVRSVFHVDAKILGI
ncbi:hypothetical protein K8352_07935 [Flavobacteriaceae bacterium F89]|uniref:Uncharacterized protein n=1 Tax=Cerina litoralis TaxID=2874477 RepID=A0AAE3ETH3_9FLAO|nr:hypothetical protein [Cerina litoralis]MCG2460673.1 hypothetical protein [Cerina litoralis]